MSLAENKGSIGRAQNKYNNGPQIEMSIRMVEHLTTLSESRTYKRYQDRKFFALVKIFTLHVRLN